MVLRKYAEEKGLKIYEDKKLIFGKIDNYYISFKQDKSSDSRHKLEMGLRGNDAAEKITKYLNGSGNSNIFLQNASYSGYKLVAEFDSMKSDEVQYEEYIISYLDRLIAFLKANDMEPCCEACGSKFNIALYEMEHEQFVVCGNCCVNKAKEIDQNNKKFKAKKYGKTILGVIGAVIGAALGGFLWVCVAQMGYMSSLIGAVIIGAAILGYKVCAGRLTNGGIIFSCIISVITLILSEVIYIVLLIYNEYSYLDYMSYQLAIASLPDILAIPEVKSAFVQDILIGLVLMALGAYSVIRRARWYTEDAVLSSVSKLADAPIDLN